jgi:hypothetical protein
MIKFLTALSLLFALNACSQIEVNATICQELRDDPAHPHIPKECKAYSQEEAKKAFDKVSDEKKVSDQDLEFNRK